MIWLCLWAMEYGNTLKQLQLELSIFDNFKDDQGRFSADF